MGPPSSFAEFVPQSTLPIGAPAGFCCSLWWGSGRAVCPSWGGPGAVCSARRWCSPSYSSRGLSCPPYPPSASPRGLPPPGGKDWNGSALGSGGALPTFPIRICVFPSAAHPADRLTRPSRLLPPGGGADGPQARRGGGDRERWVPLSGGARRYAARADCPVPPIPLRLRLGDFSHQGGSTGTGLRWVPAGDLPHQGGRTGTGPCWVPSGPSSLSRSAHTFSHPQPTLLRSIRGVPPD